MWLLTAVVVGAESFRLTYSTGLLALLGIGVWATMGIRVYPTLRPRLRAAAVGYRRVMAQLVMETGPSGNA